MDEELYIIGRHSYGLDTIRWAHETGEWHKLKGPLSNDAEQQRKAVAWARR